MRKLSRREKYCIYANNLLKKCPYFLNIYELISENGFIKPQITEDGIHLDYNNEMIREIVETEIYKLIKLVYPS